MCNTGNDRGENRKNYGSGGCQQWIIINPR